MDIGKGDWVEALQSACGAIKGMPYFVEGTVPQKPAPDGVCASGHALDLYDRRLILNLGKPGAQWCMCLFRPLRKPPEETIIKKEKVDA